MVPGNVVKLYQNLKSGFMDRSIFTAMMIDLSEYLNVKYPGEQFAVMMDNDSFHSLLKVLPHENMVFIMIPSDCTVTGMNYLTVCIDFRYISLTKIVRNLDFSCLSLKGCLQPLDLLYNAAYKLQFKSRVENFLLDCHFNNEKLQVTDEKGAHFATDVYKTMSRDVIQAHWFCIE